MITGETIVAEGLERFPEASARYEAMLAEWQGKFPGTYNVYMEVFRPLLVSSLADKDSKLAARFGVFFEDVFTDGDAEAQNVIWLKFFKWFFSHEVELDRFLPVCGPTTRKAMRDAASRWNVSVSIRLKLLC
jgi:hypothetical protein